MLDILTRSHNSISNSTISESVGCTIETVHPIVSQRSRIAKCSSSRLARGYLELKDKLKVIFLGESGTPRQEILGQFSISPQIFRRVVHKKDVLQSHAKNGRLMKTKKELYAKYAKVEADLEDFIAFVRSLGFPVTQELMQQRALTTAITKGITNFKASNGYIENFMRRAGIQISLRLLRGGGSTIPNVHKERMNQIQEICSMYSLRKIYNMDESGLSYRLCPSISYFSSSENRRDVQGTDLQKNRDRTTIVMSANTNAMHILPLWYIGHAANPRCFRDSSYAALKSFYSNQRNALMDTNEYNTWLRWWFDEVRKVTQEDILLLMDNCGSHAKGMNLTGLHAEFLPPKSTRKYQPLDLGIIANAKIRYRTIFLSVIIDKTIRWNTGEHDFQLSSQHGRWGVDNGYLPHVADAMTMLNKACPKLLPSTVQKY